MVDSEDLRYSWRRIPHRFWSSGLNRLPSMPLRPQVSEGVNNVANWSCLVLKNVGGHSTLIVKPFAILVDDEAWKVHGGNLNTNMCLFFSSFHSQAVVIRYHWYWIHLLTPAADDGHMVAARSLIKRKHRSMDWLVIFKRSKRAKCFLLFKWRVFEWRVAPWWMTISLGINFIWIFFFAQIFVLIFLWINSLICERWIFCG